MRVTSHINLLKVNEAEDATDVVHVSWLLRCFQKFVLLPYRPSEVLGATEATQDELLLLYDNYGDSFTEDADLEELKKAMDKIDEMVRITVNEMKEVARCLFLLTLNLKYSYN